MYVSAPWSVVHAIDARTGKKIWTFDPEVARDKGYRGCCDVVNRGVALHKGKVFVGAYDGRLIALDAVTGKKVWEKDTIIDHKHSYTITGAPRVANGRVIIGNGGAEYGVRGYVTAYDAETGNQAWRWFVVPGDPDKPYEDESMAAAAKTWDPAGKYWVNGGGGTVWDSITFDPDLNMVYLGTGNGSPWNRNLRSPAGGDNLYLASIVALNADTGKYLWHYQETPGDNWDYTSTQPMILADVTIDGAAAQGHPARAEERLLLRHRPHQRQVHLGQELRRRELGHRLRRQRPADRGAGRALAGQAVRHRSRPLWCAQLASDVVQSQHRAGLPAGAEHPGQPDRPEELEARRQEARRVHGQPRLERRLRHQRHAAQGADVRPADRLGSGEAEGGLAPGACLALERRHAHDRG